MDEAERHGIAIDERSLAKDLGIPVIPTSAIRSIGIPELLQAIHQVATGDIVCKPHAIKSLSNKALKAIDELNKKIMSIYPELPNSRWVAMRLLDGDQHVVDALKNGDFQTVNL
jgi:ferrous iron transport protein B